MKTPSDEAMNSLIAAEKEEKTLQKKASNKSKFAPKKISKEEIYQALSDSLNDLKDYAENFNRMVQSLEKSRSADVSFSTIDDMKKVLSGHEVIRKKTIKLRDLFKSRARSKLAE